MDNGRRLRSSRGEAGVLCDLEAGETLLVSTNEPGTTASLWRLQLNGPGVAFILDAEPLWAEALALIPRVLPVLSDSLADDRRLRPTAVWLDSWAAPGAAATREHSLKGRSFGLAFVLAASSRAMDRPLRPDVVALAEFVPLTGRLAGVEHLRAKIQAIEDCLPAVRTVLVHHTQVAEARDATARLDVEAITSVGDAFRPAFGIDFETSFDTHRDDGGRRRKLAQSLFDMATLPYHWLPHWSAVARAAEVALRWPEHDAREKWQLENALAIARRHVENKGTFALPAAAFLEGLQRDQIMAWVAHAVQHTADTGTPDETEVLALVQQLIGPHFPPPPDRLHELVASERWVAGAFARLYAVTGRERLSLQMQRRLAALACDSPVPADVSYPLSEAFRLAGVLTDHAELRACEDLLDRVIANATLDEPGVSFVDLARARASVLTGGDVEEADRVLRRLVLNASGVAPDHVQWSAARWRVRLLRQVRRGLEAASARAAIAAAVDPHAPQTGWAVANVLCEIDDLVDGADAATVDPDRARALVDRFRALEPGITQLLTSGQDDPVQAATTIARFYPY